MEQEKKYFSIKEVAEKIDETPSTLRFWEKEYCLKILRANGIRKYTQKDIDALKNIQRLRRDAGLTIKGAKNRLKNDISYEEKIGKAVEMLKTAKKFLQELNLELKDKPTFAESFVVTENDEIHHPKI